MSATLAIVGLPKTGKTTLANSLGAALGLGVLHTDDFVWLPWAEQADAAMSALNVLSMPNCVIEGITVARMFRRGFNPDCVLWLLGKSGMRSDASMRKLISNGLEAYNGRVLRLPYRPSLDAALFALGSVHE